MKNGKWRKPLRDNRGRGGGCVYKPKDGGNLQKQEEGQGAAMGMLAQS